MSYTEPAKEDYPERKPLSRDENIFPSSSPVEVKNNQGNEFDDMFAGISIK
jgi:hypothetical protein